MDGLWFLIAALGVSLVIVWSLRNDAVGLSGETKGLFRLLEVGKRDRGAPER